MVACIEINLPFFFPNTNWRTGTSGTYFQIVVALAKLHVYYLKLRTISGFSKKGSTSKVTVALPSVPSPLYNICSPPFSASRPASRLAKGTLPPLKLTERTNTSVDHPLRRQTHLPRTVPHSTLVIQFHRNPTNPLICTIFWLISSGTLSDLFLVPAKISIIHL